MFDKTFKHCIHEWSPLWQRGLTRGMPFFTILSFGKIETNEEYWKNALDFVLKLKKYENKADKLTDEDYFNSLDLENKVSLLTDLLNILGINAHYIYDYVVTLSGNLIIDDMCCSVFEDSGDCEDLSMMLYYCYESFRSIKNYNDNVLNSLRQLLNFYVLFHAHSYYDQNDGRCSCYHVCGVLIHKGILYENILENDKSMKILNTSKSMKKII